MIRIRIYFSPSSESPSLQAQSPAAEQAPPQQQEGAAELQAHPQEAHQHSQAHQVIQQQGQNLGATTSI
jgi:hypothetical protein